MSQLALFAEIEPASTWCQRWSAGRARWRHPNDRTLFRPAGHTVEALDEATARAYVVANHYSRSYPAALRRYGLWRAGRLVGVAVLGVPTSPATLTRLLPGLAPYVESATLARFVLDQEVAYDGESWFLARVFHEAAAVGLRGVVSFADPVPRRAGGRVIFPGHVGVIYQATNAVYAGRTARRVVTLLPNGEILNDRAKSKVRGQERGHEAIERRLVALGARPPGRGQRSAEWLSEALDAVGAVALSHSGNHRYVWAIGDRAQRRRTRIAVAARPYPKGLDTEQ